MMPFKHILVATDFGEASQAAIDFALTVAAKFGSKLTLVHVYPTSVNFGPSYGDGLDWPVEDLGRAAQKELDVALRDLKARRGDTEAVLVKGDTSEKILETAKARSADLIVMGTHGRRGAARVFLGSVAEKVVRLSPIPVLTVSGKSARAAREAVIKEIAT